MSFSTTGNLVSSVNIDIANGLLSNVDDSKITIDGDLDVTGAINQTTINELKVADPLVHFGNGNAGDDYDLGWWGSYVSSGNKYCGFARKAAGQFALFDGLTTIPDATSVGTVSSNHANLNLAKLYLDSGASPTIIWGGEASTGFKSETANTIDVTVLGTLKSNWNSSGFSPSPGVRWSTDNTLKTIGGAGFNIVNASDMNRFAIDENGNTTVSGTFRSNSTITADAGMISSSVQATGTDLTLTSTTGVVKTGSGKGFTVDGSVGDVQFSSDGLYQTFTAGVETVIKSHALAFTTNNDVSPISNVLVLDDAGNVGIGESTPSHKLTINGSSSATSPIYEAQQTIIRLKNTNSTPNNYSYISWEDSTSNYCGGLGMQYKDHTNHYADMVFYTRGSTGYGERVRINGNGNVGIGELTPLALLQVGKTDNASAVENTIRLSGWQINSGSDYGTMLFANESSGVAKITARRVTDNYGTALDFKVGTPNAYGGSSANSATVMSVAYNGVGIGLSPTTDKLEVLGNARIIYSGNSQGDDGRLLFVGNGGTLPGVILECETQTSGDKNLVIHTSYQNGAPAERVRIDGSGNVGIGTSPSDILHVYKNQVAPTIIRVQNPATSGFAQVICQSDTDTLTLNQNGSAYGDSASIATTANTLTLTSAGGSMSIDGSGNVGIGGTPSYALHVLSSTATTIGFNHSYFDDVVGSTLWQYGTRSYNIGLKVDQSVWALSYASTSDERIKTEITETPDDTALQQVNALECKSYHYKDPAQRKEHKTIGFIAQEVETVVPNAVSVKTGYIPDELRVLTNETWVDNTLIVTDLDVSTPSWTGKMKFMCRDDEKDEDAIEICVACDLDADGNKTNKFTFEKTYNEVFLHGREVDDFHTVDKHMICALHHSAIQELTRMVSDLTARIQALENP